MKKKVRLILFPDCNRDCVGCCNKDYNFDEIPTCEDVEPFDEVILTGGEPMLKPELVLFISKLIKQAFPEKRIILYTAKPTPILDFVKVMEVIDGVTLTLHENTDVPLALSLNNYLKAFKMDLFNAKSFRINAFSNVNLFDKRDFDGWWIKYDMVWMKDCPIPEGETLMKFWR